MDTMNGDDMLPEVEWEYLREMATLEDEFRRLGDDEAPRWGSV